MRPIHRDIVRFGPFELDLVRRVLSRRGVRLKLQKQPFQVLALLIERSPSVVSRDEIKQRLWGDDVFIDVEQNINFCIRQIRAALCDSSNTPRFIETLPRQGYCFVANLEEIRDQTLQVVDAPISDAHGTLRRQRSLIAGSAVAVAVLLAFSWPRSTPAISSIAVLPLTNLESNHADDYFADGVTEELITELARRGALRVISRTSVMRFKRTSRPLPDVARELGVDALIEGTIRRSGDHIRITVQLIGISPERHLWADAYEADLRDAISLQREFADGIVDKIQNRLSAGRDSSAPRRRLDPDAYEAYLRGLHFLAQRNAESIKKAAVCFHQALEHDPQYANAYAGLAEAYLQLVNYEILTPQENFIRAKEYADHALQLDSSLSNAYMTRGAVMSYYVFDWAAAERDLRRAISLNPSSANAHHWYAEHLINVGNAARAVVEMKLARDLDPLSLPFNSILGRVYRDARLYEDAIRQCKKTLDLDPNFSMAHWCLGQAYVGVRRYTAAIAEFERAIALGTTPMLTADLGWAYAASGNKAKANAVLQLLMSGKHGYVSPYLIGSIYGALGRKDQAFRWLQKAYDMRDSQMAYLSLDPELDSLRSDRRFSDLIRQLKIPE